MSDDDQAKPKSTRASKLTYSSSRANRHTNESPSFKNRLHMRPPKANHAFVKNSASQKKQQMMESLRRAAPHETDDEDSSREAAGFKPFVATSEAFISGPNYAQIKRDRTASAMSPYPVSFSLSIILSILNPILNFSFLIRCFMAHRTWTQCRCSH